MISRSNFLAALPGAGMLRRADDLTHVRIDAGEIIARESDDLRPAGRRSYYY